MTFLQYFQFQTQHLQYDSLLVKIRRKRRKTGLKKSMMNPPFIYFFRKTCITSHNHSLHKFSMEQQPTAPAQQEQPPCPQPSRAIQYHFDESDIDFLAECIAKTLVSQSPQELAPPEKGNETNELVREEKEPIQIERESAEQISKDQVSPKEKEMMEEGKWLVFDGLSFKKAKILHTVSEQDKQLESVNMFEIDWAQLEQLPLYEIDNTAKQFRIYPTLSQRLQLETIIAAHYHHVSGISLQTYSTGLTLPSHSFTPSELQLITCTMLLTAYRHLESYVKRKLRTDIVRIEGEDMAQMLKMLVRIGEWKARKCAQTWLKFILFAYDLSDQAGGEPDIKDLYVYIQAYAHNEQYTKIASQQVLDQNQQRSFCRSFLERKSFPEAVLDFNKKYDNKVCELTLRNNFERILSRALKMLAQIIQKWQLCDSIPPFLNQINKKILVRHPQGHELRLKLVSMYMTGQASSYNVTEAVSSLKEFLIKTDKHVSKQTLPSSKQKSTQPIQEESERDSRSNRSNHAGSKNHASRTRLSRMVDEEYDVENQVDQNRDHKGRFTPKKSSKPSNGLPLHKQKTLSFAQGILGQNRLKMMSRYQ